MSPLVYSESLLIVFQILKFFIESLIIIYKTFSGTFFYMEILEKHTITIHTITLH